MYNIGSRLCVREKETKCHLFDVQSRTISLFKYLPGPGGVSGTWELYDANVSPSFYNVNEDARSAKAEWFVEAGELEAKVCPLV
jgi:hypothetical protein